MEVEDAKELLQKSRGKNCYVYSKPSNFPDILCIDAFKWQRKSGAGKKNSKNERFTSVGFSSEEEKMK